MKLTNKDAEFLTTLSQLLQQGVLRVTLREDGLKRFVLRQNYGAKITEFGMTRQGVRWRFHHLMNAYISAYETILFIETRLGTELRAQAMAIAQQRAEHRRKAQEQAEKAMGKYTKRGDSPS